MMGSCALHRRRKEHEGSGYIYSVAVYEGKIEFARRVAGFCNNIDRKAKLLVNTVE